jgi:hypothetical protein
MKLNAVPKYNMTDNPTQCCPRFDPTGWDLQELHFENKRFLKAKTHSLFHIPLNVPSVFSEALKVVQDKNAISDDNFIVLSCEKSPWTAEHLFSVNREIPGREMVKLTGSYLTKVFEGSFKSKICWRQQLENLLQIKGKKLKKMYYFYTTCPNCAKSYGKNYVVGIGEYE